MGKQLTFDFDDEFKKDYVKDIENALLTRSDFVGMSIEEAVRKIEKILEYYKLIEKIYEYGVSDGMDVNGNVEIVISIKENPLPTSLRNLRVSFETKGV
jgi:hypothetical protein